MQFFSNWQPTFTNPHSLFPSITLPPYPPPTQYKFRHNSLLPCHQPNPPHFLLPVTNPIHIPPPATTPFTFHHTSPPPNERKKNFPSTNHFYIPPHFLPSPPPTQYTFLNNSLFPLPASHSIHIHVKTRTPRPHSGSYSCMYAEFYFSRELGFFLIQNFIPSVFIVALSWLSFWIDYRAIPGRVSLGVLTFLTIFTQR